MKKEDKIKLCNKFFKWFFFVSIMAFLTLYISQATGYYEYSQHKKVSFTAEQIKKFEADVAKGKNVSIEDYLENTNKDYNNKISQMGYFISSTIGNGIRTGIEGTFKALNKLIENNE